VNEVFFDDVKMPAENLVGEENKGWDYAKFLLSNERTSMARVGVSKERIARAKHLAQQVSAGEGTLWDDPGFRKRVARIEVQKALEITQMRVVGSAREDSDNPAPTLRS
jgi:alkylation response protein AidB-like acyl-CoA dehydrogenase